jgi:hypothetical protein
MITQVEDRHNKECTSAKKARHSKRGIEKKETSLSSSRPAAPGPFRVTAGLTARTVYVGNGTASLVCPDCSNSLSLHQPEEDQPQYLLGICEECSKWSYIVETESRPGWVVMIELPGRDFVFYVMSLAEANS